MSEVVRLARGWLGTPYVHQASAKGAGCDCLGLLRGIWRELHGAEPEPVPPYTPNWAERDRQEALIAAAERHLCRVDAGGPEIGDVLLFRMKTRGMAKHIGICSGHHPPAFIHAYDRKGVVESPLSAAWAARIAGVFRFPDQVSGR